MVRYLDFDWRLKRIAGAVMLAVLALFIFAAHSHHICDPHGNPDSACPKGAAHSHVHWPEAGDDYANPVQAGYSPAAPEMKPFHPEIEPPAPESLTPEAPQHVPIAA